jgi:hypothetical protein
MPPKILRRCTICKKFHASYLVEDVESGKYYLCYSCWKSRQIKTLTVPEMKLKSKPRDTDMKICS